MAFKIVEKVVVVVVVFFFVDVSIYRRSIKAHCYSTQVLIFILLAYVYTSLRPGRQQQRVMYEQLARAA
jgi:hypothetical protein